jgi:MFS family permease
MTKTIRPGLPMGNGGGGKQMSGTTTGKTSGITLVIAASALGTAFEWYDFFVYGTLATVIAKHFFPADNPSISLLIALATFGVGFGMRPLGAVIFGVLGDRLGRKYTFLATVALMGGATAAIGLLPDYASIGLAAPILLLLARVAQGLALGGEFGGAAVYVAEHAPANRRGLYTSFIQAGVIAGFLLSLGAVLLASAFVSPENWERWGWRLPFLFSLALLAVSLWVRLKLHESPVFSAMAAEGNIARNPLRESFDSWAKVRRILMVLFGIAAGLTVIFYTAQFQSLYFLQSALRIADTPARLIVGGASVLSLGCFILVGWLSDKIGRKKPIVIGYVLTLATLFPLFHWMAAAGNPDLARAVARAPVVVTGSDCAYDPFATKGQATACGKLLDTLSKKGVAYTKLVGAPGAAPGVTIGGVAAPAEAEALERALEAAGYRIGKVTPSLGAALQVMLAITLVSLLSALTFGPVTALLNELFPARVRYTSMSIPYHVGTGYFGGFLPFISQYIVARSGDPFAGLWYTIVIVAVALVITVLWLPETAGKELD